jgi:ABC-type sugar transport system ATPase subunit
VKPVLVAMGLRKTYGGIEALKGVDFDLNAGEIHALCGENGAGKSTLVRIIAGLTAPDSGETVLDGVPLRPGHRTDPRLVSVVYQELSIIPHLSVIDNVLMGDPSVTQVYRRGAYAPDVRRRLDEMGFPTSP